MKEHPDSESKYRYSEDDSIKMTCFLIDKLFVVFVGRILQQSDSQHSYKNNLHPSSSRQLSLLIRSEIRAFFALDGKEIMNISVQFHVQVFVKVIMSLYVTSCPGFATLQCHLVSKICNIHDLASLVVDCKSWTLGWDSLVPPSMWC